MCCTSRTFGRELSKPLPDKWSSVAEIYAENQVQSMVRLFEIELFEIPKRRRISDTFHELSKSIHTKKNLKLQILPSILSESSYSIRLQSSRSQYNQVKMV